MLLAQSTASKKWTKLGSVGIIIWSRSFFCLCLELQSEPGALLNYLSSWWRKGYAWSGASVAKPFRSFVELGTATFFPASRRSSGATPPPLP